MAVDIYIDKKQINRNRLKFTEMAKTINGYLKEDGMSLTFEGYTNTLKDYINLKNYDFDGIGALMLDLNLWSNYFSDLEGFIEMQMLKNENKYLYVMAFCNGKEIDDKLEKELIEAKNRQKHFKLFLKHIITQKKMFTTAYNNCSYAYREALRGILYKYN